MMLALAQGDDGHRRGFEDVAGDAERCGQAQQFIPQHELDAVGLDHGMFPERARGGACGRRAGGSVSSRR